MEMWCHHQTASASQTLHWDTSAPNLPSLPSNPHPQTVLAAKAWWGWAIGLRLARCDLLIQRQTLFRHTWHLDFSQQCPWGHRQHIHSAASYEICHIPKTPSTPPACTPAMTNNPQHTYNTWNNTSGACISLCTLYWNIVYVYTCFKSHFVNKT